MANKNTEDYLKEGIYGTKLPKQGERDQFLGTLRERILLALTTGDVIQGRGLQELKEEMKENPDAKLLLNGQINYSYFKEMKTLAKSQNIPYTSVANEEKASDIGAVLTLDRAIEREEIYLQQEQEQPVEEKAAQPDSTFLSKVKSWFS